MTRRRAPASSFFRSADQRVLKAAQYHADVWQRPLVANPFELRQFDAQSRRRWTGQVIDPHGNPQWGEECYHVAGPRGRKTPPDALKNLPIR